MLSGKWQPFCISLNMSSVFDAGGNWVAMDLSQSFPANEVLRIKIIADEIRKYNVKVQLKETGKWDLLGELIFLNDGGYIEKHSSFSWNSAAVGGVGRLGWGWGMRDEGGFTPYVEVTMMCCLTHLPQVPHIWVSELRQHWFR